MKKTRDISILWIEAVGFLILIVLSWITEAARIPHLLFNEAFTPNWDRAVLRTLVILAVWTAVHLATRRLLKRLHYLEEFLRVCSWCRKVGHGEKWVMLEEYFDSKFATPTTHGMCPDCMAKKIQEIDDEDLAAAESGKRQEHGR